MNWIFYPNNKGSTYRLFRLPKSRNPAQKKRLIKGTKIIKFYSDYFATRRDLNYFGLKNDYLCSV